MKNKGTLKVTSSGARDVLFERIFDAKRQAVFDALTQPRMIREWIGPHGYRLAHCEIDLRVGGSFRYVLRAPDGTETGWGGRFVEVEAPDCLVHSQTFDDWPMMEARVACVLSEEDGRTVLSATLRYASGETRDAVLASGMAQGAAESYDRLAALLAEQQVGEK